jgi:hypothetical protein
MNRTIFVSGLTAAAVLSAHAMTQQQDLPRHPQLQQHPLERSPEWSEAEINRPGEPHTALQPVIGEWTALVTVYRNGEEHESRGTLRNEWTLGERFIRGTYTEDEANGEAREGISFLGYNNATDQYEAVWMDTSSTQMMTATGYLEPATRVLTLTGTYACPMSGAEIPTRIVARLETPDRIIWEMFERPPAQREHKTLEIVYTRRDQEGLLGDPMQPRR